MEEGMMSAGTCMHGALDRMHGGCASMHSNRTQLQGLFSEAGAHGAAPRGVGQERGRGARRGRPGMAGVSRRLAAASPCPPAVRARA